MRFSSTRAVAANFLVVFVLSAAYVTAAYAKGDAIDSPTPQITIIGATQ